MVALLLTYTYRCPRCGHEAETEEAGVRLFHQHLVRVVEDSTIEVEHVLMTQVDTRWV